MSRITSLFTCLQKMNKYCLFYWKKQQQLIQEYFANLSTLQDFSQECVIDGTQGHNVDTKVVEESPWSFAFEGSQSVNMKVIQAPLMCVNNINRHTTFMFKQYKQAYDIHVYITLMFKEYK
jgi:hypothetical protein